ncbi:ATP-binding protein [Bryobacter aggregatus]|uniref:ATP-binding protein n=1 Tax=Bryobacter aggregatus TaxID=360054 RepID=UPI0006910A3C|nr:ATP-binding protein [Bryobacter aggregatus]
MSATIRNWIFFALLAPALAQPGGGVGAFAASTRAPLIRSEVSLSEALLESWRWVEFTKADGLPSVDILQIIETGNGTIWASTAAGPVWYDGYRWFPVKGVEACPFNHSGRAPRQIQPYGEDRIFVVWSERLFVVTPAQCSELSLSAAGEKIKVYSIGPLTKASESKTLVEDTAHNFYEWNGGSLDLGPPVLSGDFTASVGTMRGNGGTAFAISRDGLIRSTPAGFEVALNRDTLKHPMQLSSTTLRALSENSKGDGLLSLSFPQDWIGIWEWSPGKPLQLVRRSNAQVARLLAIAENGDAVAVYNSNQVWVREGGNWTSLKPIPMALRTATGIYFDSHHRLWATSTNGLRLLRGDDQRWLKMIYPFPDLKNHFESLAVDRDAALWMGTADGVIVLRPDGTREELATIGSQRLGIVTGLAHTSNRDVWLSSGSSFTGVYRRTAGQWRHYGPQEGLPDSHIHKLVVDSHAALWALSTGGGRANEVAGPYLWNGVRFEPWSGTSSLIDPHVYSVTRTADGALWFAAHTAISRLKNGQWKHWGTGQGIKSPYLFFITERPGGGVYFLDRTNGLGEIDGKDQIRYTAIGTTAATNSAWELRIAPSGNLWVSTRGGLFVRRDGEWSWIGQPAGLDNQELWPVAFWNNRVCTGSDGNGLFCLNDKMASGHPPRIQFDPLHMDGTSATTSWHVFTFGDSATTERSFSRYRLDNGPWSEWISAGKVTFPSLGAGSHRLEVEAKDQFGLRSNRPELFEFTVPAPFYQQSIFLVPVGISIAATLIAILAFIARKVEHNRQLAEKEERFRALIEYSSVGITLRDRNHRVFYVSPAVSAILGYEPEELIGDYRDDILHPDDVDSADSRSRSLVDIPGQTLRSRVRMRHKNGEYRWIEITDRNLLQNSAVAAIVTNFRDVTDSTRAEFAAAEARSRAEQANQAKSDFLAMISHEIRTPMNGITGMCHLLLDTTLNKEQQEYAETIAHSAQSLLALINDVLDFSRIEAGKLSIERAPIDAKALVEEVAQLMRVRADQKRLRLITRYPEDAPRGFYGDALRIRQVLINLVGNAVKFTHEGEVRMEVEISYQEGSQYNVCIRVSDTGIGIAPEKLPLVFDKFTQADLSTTRRYGGSGLGLSICRRLTELMGGTIQASSGIGKGSEFRLDLPMDIAPESALERQDASRQALRPLPESLAVLLVEDNTVNQKLAVRLLERLGCTVAVANSGVEALAQLAKHDYNLILMDCQMPEMDGYETTRRIRASERGSQHMPIVAITANAMESDLERCISSGMDSYLTKPIDFVKLRDALETWGIDSRGPKATSGPSEA